MRGALTIFLLLATTTLAANLADYPGIFVHDDLFDPLFVVGEEAPSTDVVSATIISTSIAKYNLTPKTSTATAYVDSDIADITKYNAIVIGNPCVSTTAAQLEGNPANCYEGLEGGTGYIKLFESNGKRQILITGISAQDRKKAAEYLAQTDTKHLTTTEFSLKTGSGSTKQAQVQQKQQEQKEPVQTVQQETENKEETKEIKRKPAENIQKKIEKKEEYQPLRPKAQEKQRSFISRFFGRIFSWIGGLFK